MNLNHVFVVVLRRLKLDVTIFHFFLFKIVMTNFCTLVEQNSVSVLFFMAIFLTIQNEFHVTIFTGKWFFF
jgi:hypothetical protein